MNGGLFRNVPFRGKDEHTATQQVANQVRQVLRSRLPCADPISGLRPEMEKKRPKNGFWPHREKGGKMAEKWENGPNG